MFSKGQRLNYRSFICNTLIFRRVEHLRGKVENVNQESHPQRKARNDKSNKTTDIQRFKRITLYVCPTAQI